MVCSGLIQRLQRWLLQCEFAKDCPLYRKDSYTCNEGDQNFCGKYKDRKYGPVLFPKHRYYDELGMYDSERQKKDAEKFNSTKLKEGK